MYYKIVVFIFSFFIGVQALQAQHISKKGVEGKANIFYLDDIPISKKKAFELLNTDPEARRILNKKPLFLGLTLGSTAVGVIFVLRAATAGLDKEDSTLSIVLASISGVSAISFGITLDKLVPRAISAYNSKFSSHNIQLGVTNHGLGIVCNF